MNGIAKKKGKKRKEIFLLLWDVSYNYVYISSPSTTLYTEKCVYYSSLKYIYPKIKENKIMKKESEWDRDNEMNCIYANKLANK